MQASLIFTIIGLLGSALIVGLIVRHIRQMCGFRNKRKAYRTQK